MTLSHPEAEQAGFRAGPAPSSSPCVPFHGLARMGVWWPSRLTAPEVRPRELPALSRQYSDSSREGGRPPECLQQQVPPPAVNWCTPPRGAGLPVVPVPRGGSGPQEVTPGKVAQAGRGRSEGGAQCGLSLVLLRPPGRAVDWPDQARGLGDAGTAWSHPPGCCALVHCLRPAPTPRVQHAGRPANAVGRRDPDPAPAAQRAHAHLHVSLSPHACRTLTLL